MKTKNDLIDLKRPVNRKTFRTDPDEWVYEMYRPVGPQTRALQIAFSLDVFTHGPRGYVAARLRVEREQFMRDVIEHRKLLDKS